MEFFTAMPSEPKRPNVLLDGLKGSRRLLIGSTFPDWLARFLLRIAGRLSRQREELEIVADRGLRREPALVLFPQKFSCRTQPFEQGQVGAFVRELSARRR